MKENLSFEKEWPVAWADTDNILFFNLSCFEINVMTFYSLQFYEATKKESCFLLMKLLWGSNGEIILRKKKLL